MSTTVYFDKFKLAAGTGFPVALLLMGFVGMVGLLKAFTSLSY
jgi:hypothetical protein